MQACMPTRLLNLHKLMNKNKNLCDTTNEIQLDILNCQNLIKVFVEASHGTHMSGGSHTNMKKLYSEV